MAYRLEAITLCTRGPVNTSAMRELWGDIEQGKLPILFDSEHNFAVGVSPVLKYSDYSVDDKSKFTLSILGVTKTFFYALEQMFSIIDSRYRCNKPLIVTTNLKLNELKHPPDLARARIYDRILERCAPILFAGKNFREDNAATIKAAARQIITSTAASHRQTATEKGEL